MTDDEVSEEERLAFEAAQLLWQAEYAASLPVRLRRAAYNNRMNSMLGSMFGSGLQNCPASLMDEAANEIDRLRKELKAAKG